MDVKPIVDVKFRLTPPKPSMWEMASRGFIAGSKAWFPPLILKLPRSSGQLTLEIPTSPADSANEGALARRRGKGHCCLGNSSE